LNDPKNAFHDYYETVKITHRNEMTEESTTSEQQSVPVVEPSSSIFDESDDEEPVRGEDYEFSSSYTFLRSRQENVVEEPFRFYEVGTPPVGFQDLLKSIKTMKQMGGSTTTRPRTKTVKTFDIKAYQKSIDLKKSLPTSNKEYRISHFRPKTGKWDGSHMPDDELVKELYRVPCRDPTGKVIFNLARDETKLNDSQQPWKPPEAAKDLPEPLCSLTSQLQVYDHLETTIARVEEEYKKMPSFTQAQSVLKARVGADLNTFKMEREKLRHQLDQNPHLLEDLKKQQSSDSPKKKEKKAH
jgi:hypothetical protein